MKMTKRFFAAWLAVLLWASTALAAESFTIVQVYQEAADDTRLHVRIESDQTADGAATALSADNVEEATVGTGDTPLLSVKRVGDPAFDGMCYVFVLDHAMQISNSHVKELKQGLNDWIDRLGERDRAAILVSESEDFRWVTDGFVSDKTILRSAVEQYGKANEQGKRKNMIFSAIREAILFASRRENPGACCIVVCSNGGDTYQTLTTAEELSGLLSEHRLPLYVAGFAQSAMKNALVNLVNLAKNSGGWAEDASPSNKLYTIDEALERLCARVRGGHELVLDCSDGFVFNGPTLVSVKLKAPSALVKRTVDLYLLEKEDDEQPAATKAPQKSVAVVSGSDSGADLVESTKSFLTDRTELAGHRVPNGYLVAAALALLVVLVLLRRAIGMRRRAAAQAHIEKEEKEEEKKLYSTEAAAGIAPFAGMGARESLDETLCLRDGVNIAGGAVPRQDPQEELRRFVPRESAAPTRPGMIEKVIIDYEIPGKERVTEEYVNPLEISIGRAPDNTLCLDYKSVSAHHAVLRCEGEELWIANVSTVENGKRNPIHVQRSVVEEKAVLDNHSRLTIGMVKLWIRWENRLPEPQYTLDEADRTLRPEDLDQTLRPDSLDKTLRGVLVDITWRASGKSGQHSVRIFDREVTVGRGENAAIRLDTDAQSGVSRLHIALCPDGDGVKLKNISSPDPRNGKQNTVWVNNALLEGEVPVRSGMQVRLGNAELVLNVRK